MYAETGDGQTDPAANRYTNAVIALTPKELKLKDWYAPTNAEWLYKRDLDMNVTPVVFPYKGRELLVGSGKEGRFFLLDSQSLGGTDHRTPLFRSDLISNEDIDFAGAGRGAACRRGKTRRGRAGCSRRSGGRSIRARRSR